MKFFFSLKVCRNIDRLISRSVKHLLYNFRIEYIYLEEKMWMKLIKIRRKDLKSKFGISNKDNFYHRLLLNEIIAIFFPNAKRVM